MKTNWLWDSRLKASEARKILADRNHPKFDSYAEKLLARINKPKTVFGLLDKLTFCQKWPTIKKRLQKDQWLKNRILFWQTIYELVHQKLREEGIAIREERSETIPAARMKLANEIKNIRLSSGLTQKGIAQKLGVIQQYISKIETGHENLSVDTLQRLADILGKGLFIQLR